MSQNEAFEFKKSGNQNFNKNNFDQAIADFTKAISLNPNDAEVYYSRGAAYYGIAITRDDASSVERAIGDYDQALKLNPDYAAVYTARGSAYSGKGEFDKALEDLNHAIQLDPKDCDAYLCRGNIYLSKKEYDRGIKDMETSLRINPDQPEIRQIIEMARMMQKTQK